MSLRLRPTTITEAKAFVAKLHRHNEPPVSGLFAVGASTLGQRDQLVAVVIGARPNGRGLDDGWTCELTRLCSDGTYNACSLLYAAGARVAMAMGYQSAITYTLASEPGTSLLAAGWEREEELPPRKKWDTPARRRYQHDLFGNERRPPEAKVRWRKWLVKSKRQRTRRAALRGKAS
jgi:hypothetical protein